MNWAEKQDRYFELIERLKRDYSNREIPKQDIYVAWCEDCYKHCKRINLWSYWQGSLDARVLLLGQDWGNFDPKTREIDKIMLSNIKKINKGMPATYFDGIDPKSISLTDRHIIDLFSELGGAYKDIDKENDKLFFTNLCLGYRNKGYSGNLRKEWFRNDLKYLVGADDQNGHMFGLLEIIMPDVVICLGKETFEAVTSEIVQRKIVLNNFYSALDTHTNFMDITYHRKTIRFYAAAHPGGMGTANRKRYCSINNHMKNGMELQKADWREIGKYLFIISG